MGLINERPSSSWLGCGREWVLPLEKKQGGQRRSGAIQRQLSELSFAFVVGFAL
jgi:hypothetical protein